MPSCPGRSAPGRGRRRRGPRRPAGPQQRRPVLRGRRGDGEQRRAEAQGRQHDAVGQQAVLHVDHREQHAPRRRGTRKAGSSQEGPNRPAGPARTARRSPTATEHRAPRSWTCSGDTPSGSGVSARRLHDRCAAARWTRTPTQHAEQSGDDRDQRRSPRERAVGGGHGGHLRTGSGGGPGNRRSGHREARQPGGQAEQGAHPERAQHRPAEPEDQHGGDHRDGQGDRPQRAEVGYLDGDGPTGRRVRVSENSVCTAK